MLHEVQCKFHEIREKLHELNEKLHESSEKFLKIHMSLVSLLVLCLEVCIFEVFGLTKLNFVFSRDITSFNEYGRKVCLQFLIYTKRQIFKYLNEFHT